MEALDKINILLVDDRPENLISLGAILDDPDYNLVSVNSGREALKHLLEQEFALILMDVQMPIMDGFETATFIKQREKTKHIPIIFITAVSGDMPFFFKGYDAGGVDYIVKPVDPKILRSKVSVFAELHRKSRQIEKLAHLMVDRERLERESRIAKLELESLKKEQAANEKYRDLVDGITNGVVWIADPNAKRLKYVSPQVDRILGIGMKSELEKEIFAHPVFSSEAEAGISNDISFEHTAKDIHGNLIWFQTGMRFSLNHDHLEVRGLSVNVSELKKAQAEAERATKIRDQFLSIASHELKTPITPLLLQLELLQRIELKNLSYEECTKRVNQGLGKAVKQVSRLSTLVDKLLDVSRLTSGAAQIQKERFNLSETLKEIIDRLNEEARQKTNQTIQFTVCEGVEGAWDKIKIEQVIVNLITNAIKYGDGKPVKVELEKATDVVRLKVHDQGIGIAPEDQERVFKLYERAVSPVHFGGLGLGLYIVNQIVQEHGGQIQLQSEVGKGSCFTVELPLVMREN